jgi:hypothetical protein
MRDENVLAESSSATRKYYGGTDDSNRSPRLGTRTNTSCNGWILEALSAITTAVQYCMEHQRPLLKKNE